ncbi:myb-like protein Q [Vanessa atalanta]|uniref:myb-like protein Q n=1 Tax=Vanessa atalanta TaxID=42275 RepID=UPI001FCD8127|nr:myb-like protein Q [Vanessa atalanta]
MRPVPAIILCALFYLGVAQDTTNYDDTNVKTNNVEPSPSVRLDPYIRKALLKALSDLEENENVTISETTDGTSPFFSENTSDEVTVSQAKKENIQIHSFVVNGQSAFNNSSHVTPMFIDKNISILSTTVGNVENHDIANPTKTPYNEIFQTRESGVNIQQVRSIPSASKTKDSNFAQNKLTTEKPHRISTTTTSTTTTTTTPKPTHNEDGENIEEVSKKDVQVFQAPLVAAFTVHQDADGVPKKVIPIYQQTNIQSGSKTSSISNLPTNIPQHLSPNNPVNYIQDFTSSEFITQQLTLQKQLEDKQRILEERLRFLQIQQRQQEELLRSQQLLLQQKEAERIQQSLFEQDQFKKQLLLLEQQKLPTQQISNFHAHKNFPQNQILNQNNQRPLKSQVSIQPSVSLDQTNTLAAQQQLPNREAVDFLIHLRTKQQNQFPLQDNHLPQGISNFLQPNSAQNFNQGLNFQLTNQIKSSDDPRQKQGTRVFRHESGVGNLGINIPNYNRFNTFDPPFTNHFSTPNRISQFSPDVELKQLLAQSNLNSRAQEDLNIVSKVLSLNHGIPFHNIPNRLSFDNRRRTRTSS